MASGYGLRGGVSRCYPFFAEYKECLKHEPSSQGIVCMPLREDYFECLHHRKEYTMVQRVVEQEKTNAKKKLGGEHEAGGH